MWVWASIMPGSTVALERSRTAAPAGIDAFDASETLSIKFPRITMTCSRRGAADFPSIRTPARMTVTAVSPVTKEDSERASRKTDRRGAIGQAKPTLDYVADSRKPNPGPTVLPATLLGP